MIAFAEDLGVDSEDVVMLVILFHLKSAVRYQLSRKEFSNLKNMQ